MIFYMALSSNDLNLLTFNFLTNSIQLKKPGKIHVGLSVCTELHVHIPGYQISKTIELDVRIISMHGI